MKVVIIDDNQAAIEALTSKLKDYDELTIAGTAKSGLKGITLLRQEQPDLLFLDVEMPDLTGLEFLEQLGNIMEKDCKVVIYTAHPTYMLPAFRGKAFDFLLKPVDEQELRKVISRFLLEAKDAVPDTQPETRGKDSERMLLYVNATDFQVVNIDDVGLFEYNHDLRVWEVAVAGREERVRLKRTVNNEALLTMDSRFVQVSQRHIININYLMEVSDSVCHLYPPFDQLESIKVGRTFRKKLTERFCAL